MDTDIDDNDGGCEEKIEPPSEDVAALFLLWRNPRRGTTHPELMSNPVWEWIFRSGLDAFQTNQRFEGPSSIETGPCWTADRFGQSSTELPDGRIVMVAGEHEDSYDPDFFIYNDVIVRRPDGRIDIYGYPPEVFAPTDFHSATLIGERILLIGSLGYPDDRRGGETQVMLLDTRTWEIANQETSGENPGWIHGHAATLSQDGTAVRITGGEIDQDSEATLLENIDEWELDLDHWRWKRLTERKWQRWELTREDDEMNQLWQMRNALQDKELSGMVSQQMEKLLDDIGDPELREALSLTPPPSDPAVLEGLYSPPMPHEKVPQHEDEYNVSRINVDGVIIRYVEESHCIMVTVEGDLPQSTLDGIVTDLRDKLSQLEQTAYRVTRRS